jgi:hypothetical protein
VSLNVPIGDPRRGVYLQWLFSGRPALNLRSPIAPSCARRRSAGALGYRDIDQLADIVARAVAKGPYLMGERFAAADIVIGSDIRWRTMFKLVPERPEFKPYVERIAARPASLRADEKDKALVATIISEPRPECPRSFQRAAGVFGARDRPHCGAVPQRPARRWRVRATLRELASVRARGEA